MHFVAHLFSSRARGIGVVLSVFILSAAPAITNAQWQDSYQEAVLTAPENTVYGSYEAASQAMQVQVNAAPAGSVPLTPSISPAADLMCTPVILKCPCGTVPDGKGGCKPGPNMFQCTCYDVTFGFVTSGICIAQNKCQAIATSDGVFDPLLKMLGQGLIGLGFQSLAGLLSGGSGSGGGGFYTGPTGPTGCSSYYQTSDISKLSDPCAQYVAPVSDTIIDTGSTGGCDPLAAALGQCGGTSTTTDTTGGCDPLSVALGLCDPSTPGDTTNGTTTDPGSTASSSRSRNYSVVYTNIKKSADGSYVVTYSTRSSDAGVDANAQATEKTRRVIYQPVTGFNKNVPGGERGDIIARSSDGTVIAGSRDTDKNSETSGFYGAQTFGNQNQNGLMASLCRNRPWANGFLSKIVSADFFDNLCKARGYQVGEPPPAPVVSTPVQAAPPPVVPAKPVVKPATTTPARATSTPVAPARVDIWAVPPVVPLGTRTSIFWSAQNVVDCTETSSDGQFSHRTLSGGSATVPIIERTTFTITCLVSDGTSVTKSVSVGLKL